MSKKYSGKDIAKILAKSILKSIKDLGKNPIEDVIDSDFKEEVNPKTLPVSRTGVMYKSKSNKLKEFIDKRKNKIKNKGKV